MNSNSNIIFYDFISHVLICFFRFHVPGIFAIKNSIAVLLPFSIMKFELSGQEQMGNKAGFIVRKIEEYENSILRIVVLEE